MRTKAAAAFFLSLLLLGPARPAGSAPCPSNGTRFEPSDGRTLLILGQDKESVDHYRSRVSQPPGGVSLYTSLSAPSLGLQTPYTIGAGTHDMPYEVRTNPYAVMNVGLALPDPAQIYNGVWDGNITTLGNLLRDTNRPIFLRIGYEFEQYPAGTFKRAFQYIVDRLRLMSVANVAFVWHSNTSGSLNSAYYPGDAYVDWVAVSIFGQGFEPGIWRAGVVADFAAAHGKPLMIAESTPMGRTTATANPQQLWNDWYAPVVQFIAQRDVKAFAYINADWDMQPLWAGRGFGDSRVEESPSDFLQYLWVTEITKVRYLHGMPGTFCSLGFG